MKILQFLVIFNSNYFLNNWFWHGLVLGVTNSEGIIKDRLT